MLSLTDTLEKVVSNTPDAKSATSIFEIELPVLNFTDSLIKDEAYITYKAGQLSNITNVSR